ncbi:Membrane steroid-binding protein 1 [Seiridium cupressi]
MPAETRGSVRQRKTVPIHASTEDPSPRVVELNSSDDEDDINGPLQEDPKPKLSAKTRVKKEDDAYSPWLDILRVITFLVLASAGLSYLISGGDSFTWGLKNPPKYLRKAWWTEQFKSPIHLTPAELLAYDGSDPEKPIYLAINGTIYDVSANSRTYGPGGSYHVFAGVDAARGFVTGCFAEDRTADLRGIEEMHIPLDDPEVDKHFTAQELVELKQKEVENARQKVHDQLKHWVNFFAKSPKYPKVGMVKREKNWLESEPRKKLCAQAEKGRPKRKVPERN